MNNLIPDTTPIDPGLFAIQWDILIEVLVLVVVISFIAERFLALLFETHWWLKWSHQRKTNNQGGTGKPLIAFVFSLIICFVFQIDVMAVLMNHPHASLLGEIITAGVIAGGSKASLKLFRDVLDIKKEYEDATTK